MQRKLKFEFDDEVLQSFIRPEAERLLEEIQNPQTSHYRRAEIGDRLAHIGDPRPGVGMNKDGLPDIVWMKVPGGTATLENEKGTFKVKPFQIARYPVTFLQYRIFFETDDGYFNDRWWKGIKREGYRPVFWEQYRITDNCPSDSVNWYDAIAFCRWLSEQFGYEVTLPTEQQWQQVATLGRKDFEYPWGSEWHELYANTYHSKL
jgi:formylglycine-generating enzyme required for sulfatase activity